MERHEYKRQNQERDSKRQQKLAEERCTDRRWWQWRPRWWSVPSDRFSFFVAFFTGVLAIVSYFQLSALSGIDTKIGEQLSIVKEQAIAMERQSFGNRAFLFMKYQFVPNDSSPGSDEVPGNVNIGICIDNVGQSPAVITRIDGSLTLSSIKDAITSDYLSSSKMPDGDLFESGTVIPAGNSICPIKLNFVYRKLKPKDIDGLGGSKLYVALIYRDIWLRPRHSWYCADLGGTGARPGEPDCYHWD
jgi:hypothetical protein